MYKKKIGIWHDLNLKNLELLRGQIIKLNISKFFYYLKGIGYKTDYSNENEQKKIIKTFQMRFRPELIDGKLDKECFKIAKSLKILNK